MQDDASEAGVRDRTRRERPCRTLFVRNLKVRFRFRFFSSFLSLLRAFEEEGNGLMQLFLLVMGTVLTRSNTLGGSEDEFRKNGGDQNFFRPDWGEGDGVYYLCKEPLLDDGRVRGETDGLVLCRLLRRVV